MNESLQSVAEEIKLMSVLELLLKHPPFLLMMLLWCD